MPEMRKCKECGKLFQPKGREQYCSDIHYRPCPICGTPVIVKYLSDPPRRCANCKSIKATIDHIKPLFDISANPVADIIESTSKSNTSTSTSKSSSESVSNSLEEIKQVGLDDIPPGKDIRKFIGRDYSRGKGFLPNHLYELSIDKDEYSYWVKAVYDWTANKEVNIIQLFSSKISIDGRFQKLNQD